jgi:diguanylate cyclase (GGDEF)-like protein
MRDSRPTTPTDTDTSALLATAIRTGEMQREGSELAVPLRAGGRLVGLLQLSRASWSEHEMELVRTFATQATVAIQNGQLYQMAALDPLTDVHARRFFDRWLPRQVHAAFAAGSTLSLLMVDMDDLKRINDGGGHLAGDRALVELGRVLRQATREPDVIARFGGDEFAVLLPDTDAPGAVVVARRILQMCAAVEVRGFGPLRCSIGATTLPRPEPYDPAGTLAPDVLEQVAEALVVNADAALYAAKRAGRARLSEGGLTRWPTRT